MRLTRPLLLLALAALTAPRIEASRTSVWESNPPATAAGLTTTNAAGPLAPLAPAGPLESIVADVEPVGPLRFDLGDVVLVESPREERFRIGLADVIEPPALRGPPLLDEDPHQAFKLRDPETRIRGLELLPPFRIGASPSLSLWPHQACGFSCREVASDSRYDPWGLAVSAARGGIVISDERSAQGETFGVTYDWAQANPDAFYRLLTDVGGMGRSDADAFVSDHQLGLTGDARRQQLARMVSTDADDLIREVKREWVSQAKWGAAGYGAGKLLAGAYRGVRGVLQFGDELAEGAAAGLDDAGNAIRESSPNWPSPSRRARGRFPQNALEGGAREGAAIAELNPNPGQIFEQRTIFDEGGRALFQGKGRRLDAVRVENGFVTEAFEITSPGEAMRARKIRQIFRGDELIAREGTFVLGLNGERIPFAPGLRTTVITRR